MLSNVISRRVLCAFLLCLLPVFAQASLETVIQGLLDQADNDFTANRLMTPAQSNAYDRYQAVLLLDQGNQRAALGVRAIAERYLDLARSQIQGGNYAQARDFVAKSIVAGGKTPRAAQMNAEILTAERRRAQEAQVVVLSLLSDAENEQQTVFKLNPEHLRLRNEQITAELTRLGQRVQDTQEYVLIYARNDAEGRWIYRLMREASKAYRVRGNIKRSKVPRVVLELPLE